jgi:hypothetical protein
VQLEGFRKIGKKSNDLIGSGTLDLPACSIVRQPTTLRRAPIENWALRRVFGPNRDEVIGKVVPMLN